MRHTNPISRRQFLRGAAGGSALVLLAACAVPTASVPADTGGAPALEAVTISFWHIWGGVRDEQLKTVLDDFSATYPEITVEPLLLPNPGYADKIVTGLAGDAPDLTMIYTVEFAPAAAQGALQSLDDRLAADAVSPDAWYPGIWNMTQWQGNTLGVPFVGNFLQLFYWNMDDFAAAGLDPEIGAADWQDLSHVMSELSTFDDNGHLDHMGFVPGGWGEWMMGTYRNGHDWYGDAMPDSIAIDHPLSQEALEFVVDLYARGGGWDSVGAALEGWGNQQLGNPMIAGVASSIRSGIFTVNIINDQKPDLPYKLGKYPHGPNGEHLDLIQACWNMVIPTNAQNPDEAWTLAKYLSRGEGHLKFMVEIQGRPAMIRDYNMAPHDAKAREKNPYWDDALEVLNGKQVSLPVSDKLGAAQNILREAFERVMLEVDTVDAALSWAQGEVSGIFG
jgi:ABC-type glycerol-3-phosphate transport system substrate-binding protein